LWGWLLAQREYWGGERRFVVMGEKSLLGEEKTLERKKLGNLRHACLRWKRIKAPSAGITVFLKRERKTLGGGTKSRHGGGKKDEKRTEAKTLRRGK